MAILLPPLKHLESSRAHGLDLTAAVRKLLEAVDVKHGTKPQSQAFGSPWQATRHQGRGLRKSYSKLISQLSQGSHAELPLARVDATTHHQPLTLASYRPTSPPVAGLEDVQGTRHARHGHGADEDRYLSTELKRN